MPDDQSAEISRRLNAVEQAISNHVSACGEQNRARDRWESKSDAEVHAMRSDIASLMASRAQMMGYVAGASAIGSIVGAVLSALIPRVIGGE